MRRAMLEHDPEKWIPVFPRDKREAFARRSCSNNKMSDEHDSTQLKHALAPQIPQAAWQDRLGLQDAMSGVLAAGGYREQDRSSAYS